MAGGIALAAGSAGATSDDESDVRSDSTALRQDDQTVCAPDLSGAAARLRWPRSPKKPSNQADPALVLASFNTWAFKREQPADMPLMQRLVAETIAAGAPLSFVLYWGKGPRCRVARHDIECLDYLSALVRRVGQAYAPGAAVTLIFTDTHAQLNGHSPQTRRRYFDEIEDAARQYGFDSCFLSALTRAAEPETSAAADADTPDEMLALLLPSARKWYRGEGAHVEAAQRYYRMNLGEARAVELAFPRSIFITFNGSKLRPLFPARLPIFFMYSLRRGFGVKPWFLPDDAVPCDDAACRCEAVVPQGG